jgi:hypothetical protein
MGNTIMSRSDLPFWSGTNAQFLSNLNIGGYQHGLAQSASTQLPWQASAHDASEQLQIFKESLRDAALISTVGINTLSGVSYKSLTLEHMISEVNAIEDSDEQVMAVDDLLREGDKLWSDQFAHIICRIVNDILTPDRLRLDDRALPRICNRIMQAALKLAPEMLQDSIEHDILKMRVKTLVEQADFAFSRNALSILEESGFMEPVADIKYRGLADESPEGLATWLKNEIQTMSQRRILPDDLSMLLDYTVTLPEELRGRMLAMMVNLFDNTMRTQENEPLNLEIGHLINELPLKVRITPLEAFYNQLRRLPHEVSRAFFPIAHSSIMKMPNIQDFRYNRSLRDLVEGVNMQGAILQEGDMMDGESIARFEARIQNQRWAEPQLGWEEVATE